MDAETDSEPEPPGPPPAPCSPFDEDARAATTPSGSHRRTRQSSVSLLKTSVETVHAAQKAPIRAAPSTRSSAAGSDDDDGEDDDEDDDPTDGDDEQDRENPVDEDDDSDDDDSDGYGGVAMGGDFEVNERVWAAYTDPISTTFFSARITKFRVKDGEREAFIRWDAFPRDSQFVPLFGVAKKTPENTVLVKQVVAEHDKLAMAQQDEQDEAQKRKSAAQAKRQAARRRKQAAAQAAARVAQQTSTRLSSAAADDSDATLSESEPVIPGQDAPAANTARTTVAAAEDDDEAFSEPDAPGQTENSLPEGSTTTRRSTRTRRRLREPEPLDDDTNGITVTALAASSPRKRRKLDATLSTPAMLISPDANESMESHTPAFTGLIRDSEDLRAALLAGSGPVISSENPASNLAFRKRLAREVDRDGAVFRAFCVLNSLSGTGSIEELIRALPTPRVSVE